MVGSLFRLSSVVEQLSSLGVSNGSVVAMESGHAANAYSDISVSWELKLCP